MYTPILTVLYDESQHSTGGVEDWTWMAFECITRTIKIDIRARWGGSKSGYVITWIGLIKKKIQDCWYSVIM